MSQLGTRLLQRCCLVMVCSAKKMTDIPGSGRKRLGPQEESCTHMYTARPSSVCVAGVEVRMSSSSQVLSSSLGSNSRDQVRADQKWASERFS